MWISCLLNSCSGSDYVMDIIKPRGVRLFHMNECTLLYCPRRRLWPGASGFCSWSFSISWFSFTQHLSAARHYGRDPCLKVSKVHPDPWVFIKKVEQQILYDLFTSPPTAAQRKRKTTKNMEIMWHLGATCRVNRGWGDQPHNRNSKLFLLSCYSVV